MFSLIGCRYVLDEPISLNYQTTGESDVKQLIGHWSLVSEGVQGSLDVTQSKKDPRKLIINVVDGEKEYNFEGFVSAYKEIFIFSIKTNLSAHDDTKSGYVLYLVKIENNDLLIIPWNHNSFRDVMSEFITVTSDPNCNSSAQSKKSCESIFSPLKYINLEDTTLSKKRFLNSLDTIFNSSVSRFVRI